MEKRLLMKEITGHTILTCLLGSPVSHSISPMMHNEAFAHLGLDYRYLAFDVKVEELETVANALRSMGARGFNLTMPHKNAMYSLCDELSPAARLSGAVNTVVIEDGNFIGHTLKRRIADAVETAYQEGYRHFLCGMAQGCDFYFCPSSIGRCQRNLDFQQKKPIL